MTADWWLGVGLGTAIGGIYGIASFLNARYAARQPGQRFLRLVISGMVARLATALVFAALVFTFTPASRLAFTVSLLTMLIIGLIAEVAFFYRQ